MLYRLAVWLSGEDFELFDEQKDLMTRLCKIMEWPVAQLMTLSLAIATDFDSVYRAWKQYHNERGHGLFEGNNEFMLTSARTIVKSGHAEKDGYADQLQARWQVSSCPWTWSGALWASGPRYLQYYCW